MRALLLLALASLAGCLQGPEPLAPPVPPRQDPAIPTSGPPPQQPGAEMAPVWRVGEAWNYTLTDATNTTLGWVRYTVEALEAVPDVSPRAYRVDMARFESGDPDHDGTPDETDHRTLRFDARTLEQVWNVCGDPRPTIGDCKGTRPELQFPLWHNKTWNGTGGGDVVIGLRWRAEQMGDLWRITMFTDTDRERRYPHQDLYDAAVGFYQERSTPHGDEREVLRLREHVS